MDQATENFWRHILTRLVNAVGVEEAREIAEETASRMEGEEDHTRAWLKMLLRVTVEHGYSINTLG